MSFPPRRGRRSPARSIPGLLALTAVVALLSGCAGPSGSTSDTAALATLTATADAVTLTHAGAETAVVVGTDSDAAADDVIATDSKGRAELDYADGSLTRLGPSTELTITELSDASAQRTVVDLKVGQTWHRVQKLVAEDAAFEVSTPVGVASVHGTAFAVTCTADQICTIEVVEGEVEFTAADGATVTVGAFEGLTVPSADGAPLAVRPLTAVDLSNEWLSDNAGADGVSLHAPDPSDALVGDWNVAVVTDDGGIDSVLRSLPDPVTITVLTCDPTCIVQVGTDGAPALQFTDQANGRYAGPSTSTEGTVCLNGNRDGDIAYVRQTSSTFMPELAADGTVSSISIFDQQAVVPVLFTCVPDVSPGEYRITLTRATS